MGLVVRFAILFLSIRVVLGHSLISSPRAMSSNHCRLGGIPMRGGIEICPGPCDMRPLYKNPKVAPKPKVTAIYERGQRVDIKYQRNNHGPGGFVRLSIVTIDQMMDKAAHAANAFHFGCWGEVEKFGTNADKKRDAAGFSLVGGDKQNPPGYYQTTVSIPAVIPDGIYVLGWAWYGGVGGGLAANTPQTPFKKGLFADYWSCAFVEIRGGDSLIDSYTPVFVNGLQKYWPEGCNAATDRPGECTYEPCKYKTKLQKPMEFASGNPPPIRQDNFMGPDGRFGAADSPLPTLVPDEEIFENAVGALKDCQAELEEAPNEKKRGNTTQVLKDLFTCRRKLNGWKGLGVLADEMRGS